mmetsp:Transcript_45384/g.150490  ORF Transcript_45384/g.150490 Transcript_45384/m.150490 type:complete len:281 (+) Transcript_45384:1583-2425(+)
MESGRQTALQRAPRRHGQADLLPDAQRRRRRHGEGRLSARLQLHLRRVCRGTAGRAAPGGLEARRPRLDAARGGGQRRRPASPHDARSRARLDCGLHGLHGRGRGRRARREGRRRPRRVRSRLGRHPLCAEHAGDRSLFPGASRVLRPRVEYARDQHRRARRAAVALHQRDGHDGAEPLGALLQEGRHGPAVRQHGWAHVHLPDLPRGARLRPEPVAAAVRPLPVHRLPQAARADGERAGPAAQHARRGQAGHHLPRVPHQLPPALARRARGRTGRRRSV